MEEVDPTSMADAVVMAQEDVNKHVPELGPAAMISDATAKAKAKAGAKYTADLSEQASSKDGNRVRFVILSHA